MLVIEEEGSIARIAKLIKKKVLKNAGCHLELRNSVVTKL